MANSIPPLLCNTPPPMDGGCFEDDDEDECSMADSLNDDDIAATVSPQNNPQPHTDLPVPDDDDDVNDVRDSPAPSQPHHNTHTVAVASSSSSTSSGVPNEPNRHTATTTFCASQSPPPLDVAPSATTSRTPPQTPEAATSAFAYRSDSPPSLDFNDPPSLTDDVDDDDDYADRLSGADCLDDLPPDGDRPETPSTESSMPSLQLSPSAATTEAPVAIAIATLVDAETPPLPSSCSLHEMLQRTDADDAATSVTTRNVTPPLDLNDSFEEFVEYEATIAPTQAQADIDCNSNTLRHGEEKQMDGEQYEEQLETTFIAFSEPTTDAFGDSNDFDADFSQFATFQTTSPSAFGADEIITTPADNSAYDDNNDDKDDDDNDDDDFGDFADVTTPAATPTVASSAPTSVAFVATTTRSAHMDDDDDDDDADDDDDFGDFSDFQQTPVEPPPALTIDVQHICARIGPLLAMMFPPDADAQSDGNASDTDEPIVVHDERTGDLTRTVLNVDEPLALRHRWLTSMGKAELVQALGIDTAKIWNQSMPRFAANLGFTPLEPMKHSEAGILRPTPVNNNTVPSAIRSASSAAAVADVPAAQFDWTGAGLVNPLDGVQAILHEAGHPQNRPPRSDAHWSLRPPAGPAAAASTADVSLGSNSAAAAVAVVEPAATQPAPFLPADGRSGNSISSSVSRVLPGIAGGLKETHIFTPSKARTMSGGGITGADDVIVIDETVVTKEYRDVEYNPQPPVSLSASYEAPAVALAPVVGGGGGVCLQPTKSGIVIDWPEPGRVSGTQLGAFEDFDAVLHPHSVAATMASAAEQQLHNNPVESFDEFLSGTLESPSPSVAGNNDVIQLNPIDAGFDDFSDYQYVPLPVPAPVAPVVVAATMLPNVGVGILQPQTIGAVSVATQAAAAAGANGLMSWSNDSGINPDEMARLEALYPTPKTMAPLPTVVSPAKTASPTRSTGVTVATADDVEWSDFVSSDAGYQPITHIINQNILKHQAQQQQSSQQHADEDDWTDFMSGGSVSSGGLTTISPLKSGALPHFAAWNAPSAQFHAAHSWQPTAPTATTFLPNLPPTPSTPRLSPKHQNGGGGSGSAGASSANGTPHFVNAVKAQPSISLIPDLGIVFGRTGSATASSSSSSSTAAFRK